MEKSDLSEPPTKKPKSEENGDENGVCVDKKINTKLQIEVCDLVFAKI